ncbi:MAG: D-alanyl-D-alanine carboxypeptidase, partial [Beijerinckiaceae bacterium]
MFILTGGRNGIIWGSRANQGPAPVGQPRSRFRRGGKVKRSGLALAAAALVLSASSLAAQAAPSIVVDADSGAVVSQSEATRPWYPASTTKMMTAYVALKAVREGRIGLETP